MTVSIGLHVPLFLILLFRGSVFSGCQETGNSTLHPVERVKSESSRTHVCVHVCVCVRVSLGEEKREQEGVCVVLKGY